MKPVGVFVAGFLASLILVPTALVAAQTKVPHGKIQRHGPSGTLRLVAAGSPVKFAVDGLCRYDGRSGSWSREKFTTINKTVGAGVVAELPGRIGLYWVQWKEDGRRFASLGAAGPVLCNDISLAPTSRSDVIATCVPSQRSASAGYVPDPRIYCRP